MVVVVIVDGQEVAVDVRVAQEHVHPWDLVHCLQQLVEVLEAAGARALHGKAAKFSVELQRTRKRRKRVTLGRAGSGRQDRCRQGTTESCPRAGRALVLPAPEPGSTKAAVPVKKSPSQKQSKRREAVFLPKH